MEASFVVFHFRPILNSPPAALKSWFEGTLIHGDGNFIDRSLIKVCIFNFIKFVGYSLKL